MTLDENVCAVEPATPFDSKIYSSKFALFWSDVATATGSVIGEETSQVCLYSSLVDGVNNRFVKICIIAVPFRKAIEGFH